MMVSFIMRALKLGLFNSSSLRKPHDELMYGFLFAQMRISKQLYSRERVMYFGYALCRKLTRAVNKPYCNIGQLAAKNTGGEGNYLTLPS